jgi:hypothetical protein
VLQNSPLDEYNQSQHHHSESHSRICKYQSRFFH